MLFFVQNAFTKVHDCESGHASCKLGTRKWPSRGVGRRCVRCQNMGQIYLVCELFDHRFVGQIYTRAEQVSVTKNSNIPNFNTIVDVERYLEAERTLERVDGEERSVSAGGIFHPLYVQSMIEYKKLVIVL